MGHGGGGMQLVALAIAFSLAAHDDEAAGVPPADLPPEAAVETPITSEPEVSGEELVTEATPPEPIRETVVRGGRPRTAASSSTVRDRDLKLRPHPRPGDILSNVPGLFVVQHAGGGKANQYFLRGFDADHGTDIALSVDGVPVNLPSHGHGQGYADLNWVIPELVKRVDVKKGPYFADIGDFGTAGAVDMITTPHIDGSSLAVSTATYAVAADAWSKKPLRTARALALIAPDVGGAHPFFAAEVNKSDSFFDSPEQLQRFNLFARAPLDFGDAGRMTVTATSYGAGWNASGQIPSRMVKRGELSHFGSLDTSDGGASQRHSLVARFDRSVEDQTLMLSAYVVHQRLRMFSNFTFFSADPVNGDQIEQEDLRTFFGAHARYATTHAVGPFVLDTRVGVQARNDVVDNSLFHDVERRRLEQMVGAQVNEGSIGLYAEEEIALPPYARLVLGARADGFVFDVNDRLEDLDAADAVATSGSKVAGVVSPKASLILTYPGVADVFLNVGQGFHSNDARGVVLSQGAVTPITRALGYEVGARTRLFDSVDIAGSLFGIELEGESVWVGDEGSTEVKGPTRRLGAEIEGRAELFFPWLFFDVDATATRGIYTEAPLDANAVALAPTFLVSSGLSVYDLAGFFGRLGVVSIADRPATEDGFLQAQGFTRVDASLGWRSESLEVALDVQNLTNTKWREAQFANVSRAATETTPASCPGGTRATESDDGTGAFAGCEDVHYTPGAPLNAMLTATLKF
jgi:outer membrane receptor protein involved in Fe transport